MIARLAYVLIAGGLIFAWLWTYQYFDGKDAQGILVITSIIAAAATGRRQNPSQSQ